MMSAAVAEFPGMMWIPVLRIGSPSHQTLMPKPLPPADINQDWVWIFETSQWFVSTVLLTELTTHTLRHSQNVISSQQLAINDKGKSQGKLHILPRSASTFFSLILSYFLHCQGTVKWACVLFVIKLFTLSKADIL